MRTLAGLLYSRTRQSARGRLGRPPSPAVRRAHLRSSAVYTALGHRASRMADRLEHAKRPLLPASQWPRRRGNTGFAVTNDNGVEFWNWFNRFGGVHAVGYPVSHRFQWKGLTVQAFQKVVFQWHPESRSVQFVNVFDELSAAGKDDWLASVQMTPHGFNWSGDAGRPWDYVVASHLAVLDQYRLSRRSSSTLGIRSR